MSEIFYSLQSFRSRNARNKIFCRAIVTLFGFSWEWINGHVKHAKNCVKYLPNIENPSIATPLKNG